MEYQSFFLQGGAGHHYNRWGLGISRRGGHPLHQPGRSYSWSACCDFHLISGEWEYTKQVSREGPDGTTEWDTVQGKVKGDKTFFKTEFKLVEYHGTVFEILYLIPV